MLSSFFSIHSIHRKTRDQCFYLFSYSNPTRPAHWFSTATDSTRPDFAGGSAYDILGIPETSSFPEIKASFRRLAKETHPDLAHSKNDPSASQRFIQILAAYEILSDSERRAHYDSYLSSQRSVMQKHTRGSSKLYAYESQMFAYKEMEVVEWLKWYRLAINDILLQKKVAIGTGYFDELEANFYSAIQFAYYGPRIESMDLLPDRFEAEERSVYETPEVLHLVSGRDVFGMVCLANNNLELYSACTKQLDSSSSSGLDISQCSENSHIVKDLNEVNNIENNEMHAKNLSYASDAYKDLELHINGKLVAVATRVPPKGQYDGKQNETAQDQIQIFLNSDDDLTSIRREIAEDWNLSGAVGLKFPLGTIMGLGTNPEESSCYVYDRSGTKTHVLIKHRTLLVKHLHWYAIRDKVSICECRCTKARLPPSRFWLFEPRCNLHDTGGWYIETFGRNMKSRTVPSQRHWDGFEKSEVFDKRLHPAMYLLALAYRALDLEDIKRRKRPYRHIVEGQMFRFLHWCKKLV